MTKLDDFIRAVGDEFPDDRLTYQKSIPTFHPETPAESADFFKLANRLDQKIFITGFGNIINPEGALFENLVTIRTDRLNQLTEIVAGDYYIVVGSGYPLKELSVVLKKHGFFLPHAELPYVGSVGGALASGLAADYKGHRLPISRYFLKADVAMPDGDLIRPGCGCFKSVSGFDIVRVFSPSWGLLGFIANAWLRVLPLSEYPNYEDITMLPIEYDNFVEVYRNPGDSASAKYSLKIKSKFDPKNILPIVAP
jgi:glycolate oxidase FAD binding subunit